MIICHIRLRRVLKELHHFLTLHDLFVGDPVVEHKIYSLWLQYFAIVAKKRCEAYKIVWCCGVETVTTAGFCLLC
jgi:hypothetical protein